RPRAKTGTDDIRVGLRRGRLPVAQGSAPTSGMRGGSLQRGRYIRKQERSEGFHLFDGVITLSAMYVKAEAPGGNTNPVKALVCLPVWRFISQQILIPQLLIDFAERRLQFPCSTCMQNSAASALAKFLQHGVGERLDWVSVQRKNNNVGL